jgi:hypothetical protein
MVTQSSSLPDNQVGAVFTPLRWAKWLADRFDLVSKWLGGATVCDPTAGEGVFIHALTSLAAERGIEVDESMLSRLFLMEADAPALERFRSSFRFKHSRDFPERNIFWRDIILDNPGHRFDILVGNPPWANFNDLPDAYKEVLKPEFIRRGLVEDTQALLLGSARVDVAALVLSVTLDANLKREGEAFFFVPLSLFMGEGAHSGFRKSCLLSGRYQLAEVLEFRESQVFPEVSARFGVAYFRHGSRTNFPIPYKVESKSGWGSYLAAPVGDPSAPLSIVRSAEEFAELTPTTMIELREEQKPRQGVNTCGANDVYIFDDIPSGLPRDFFYPLITKECFRGSKCPKKYILLPYDARTGRPLDKAALCKHPGLYDYFVAKQENLLRRKGAMLNASIKRGTWWGCLGVGLYSFAPFKVVWEAYGKQTFNPRVFSSVSDKPWQANQAMHAFIPCWNSEEAESLCAQLRNSKIERYLRSLNAAGTCNWAQPGRIRRFLSFSKPTLTQTPEFQFS